MNTRNSRNRLMCDRSGDKSVKHLRSERLETEEYRQYSGSILKRRQITDKTNQSIGQSFNRQSNCVKRGRGRPPKPDKSSRKVEETNGLPVVTIDNPLAEGLAPNIEINESSEGSVGQNGSNYLLTIDTPPKLSRQFCPEINLDALIDEGFISTNDRSVPTIVNSGQECSLYVDLSKQLTQRIESEPELNELNLMAALKYALLKCFSANINETIGALKNASRDITIGASYDINNRFDNQRMIKTRAQTQTDDKKNNWSGTVYTPQPKYD